MAEGARLESVYTATYRGFESPPHRHILRRARTQVRAFFSHVAPTGGMRTPDRGSTTGAASWTDREPASGLPRRGERSESIPPLTAIFEMRACTQVRALFFYILRRGDENPRPGFDNWRSQLDRPRARERAAPTKTPGAFLNNACVGPAGARPMDGPSNGERSESIPPSPPYFKKSSYASTGFFSHVAPQTSPGSASMPLPGYQTVSAR